MHKFFKVILATILAIFTIPFGGISALAEGDSYENIKDGEYELTAKLLKEGTDEESAAAGFMSDQVTLELKNGKAELTFFIPDNPAMDFKEFVLEKEEAQIKRGTGKHKEEEVEGSYYTFQLKRIKADLTSTVTYSVDMPPLVFDHEGVVMDIQLVGLDELPVVEDDEEETDAEKDESEDTGSGEEPEEEKPKYEPAEDERVVGSLVSESDADEVYELKYDTDSRATNNQLENPTKLLVKGDKEYIQIPVNEGGAGYFKSLKFNGEEVVWNSIEEGPYTIQYELEDGIGSEIDVSMVIDTGHMVMPHDDIALWFDQETLKMTKVKDKRVTGDILKESDADSVQLYEFDTDSQATKGQLENPVKLLEKDKQKYIQIPVSARGAGYFKSLKFNGEEVLWNNIEESPYIIQYELEDKVDAKIDVSMIIDTGFMIMPHDGIELWLANTVSSIELNNKTDINAKDRLVIDESGNSLKTPNNLPNNVKVEIKSEKEYIEKYGNQYADQQDLELAGEVYEFTFENLSGEFDSFELVMQYNPADFSDDEYDVDIYYFNIETKEWEAMEADVNKRTGELTLEVNSFSTYGVFAQKKANDPVDDPIEVPKNAEKVDYVILQKDGKDESIADSFFVKPGLLFEKDGKVYIQVKVNNGDMIEKLSSEYGEAVIVNENKDGSIDVQFQINADQSNTELQMRIVVPGMYDMEHDAIFSIKKETTSDPSKKPEPEKKPGQKTNEEKTTTEKPGNVYAIDYVVKHATEDEVSAADGFFVKPGHVLEKDGKKYLQVTINSWNFINSLEYNGQDVLVAKINKDGSALVQFLLGDEIPDVINLLINLTVPGVYENQEHAARLVLNSDSIQEVDSDEHVIYTTPVKPEFGKGGKTPVEKTSTELTKRDKAGNPQTGDTSKIFLYTMLLIGSLIPLGIQLRRRFSRA